MGVGAVRRRLGLGATVHGWMGLGFRVGLRHTLVWGWAARSRTGRGIGIWGALALVLFAPLRARERRKGITCPECALRRLRLRGGDWNQGGPSLGMHPFDWKGRNIGSAQADGQSPAEERKDRNPTGIRNRDSVKMEGLCSADTHTPEQAPPILLGSTAY